MLRRVSDHIRTRRRHRTMHAADEEAFAELLSQLGLLEPLADGQLRCYYCREILNADDVQGIRKVEGQFVLFCSKPECTRTAGDTHVESSGSMDGKA